MGWEASTGTIRWGNSKGPESVVGQLEGAGADEAGAEEGWTTVTMVEAVELEA